MAGPRVASLNATRPGQATCRPPMNT